MELINESNIYLLFIFAILSSLLTGIGIGYYAAAKKISRLKDQLAFAKSLNNVHADSAVKYYHSARKLSEQILKTGVVRNKKGQFERISVVKL